MPAKHPIEDRAWLRSFLNLAARADAENIPDADVRRQEDTILRALDVLRERPGVILADEVGMGKTYEALGIAAGFRHRNPKSRIVVLTPGPDLNHKWHTEFQRFSEMYDFASRFTAATRLTDFAAAVRKSRIVIAPVTIFQAGRSAAITEYIISLYAYWKELHGLTTNAILERVGYENRVDVTEDRFLNQFPLERLERHLRRAFKRTNKNDTPGLDDLYETGGLRGFEDDRAVKAALARARFSLVRAIIPRLDLLIVDEAHKLKSAGSLRSRGMRRMFRRRFEKALFLTATPFQLDIAELRDVFHIFTLAKRAPENLGDEIDQLLAAIRDYQSAYDEFQTIWSRLDLVAAGELAEIYRRDPALSETLESPSLEIVADKIRTLRRLKDETIQPAFRNWMIRSLREEKRHYRDHQRHPLPPDGEAALPFLVYERFIAELFRRRQQTHKAQVEINMVSSFAAARAGNLMADDHEPPAEAAPYRDLLRTILEELEPRGREHPKLDFAIRDALDAADHGEKTLIFCSRVATLEQLRRELDRVWERRLLDRWLALYPDDSADTIFDTADDGHRRAGRHSLLRNRFHKGTYPLYLALRERYLRTLVPIADWALANIADVTRLASDKLTSIRVGAYAAQRLDYQVAKRCVEQAAADLWHRANLPAPAGLVPEALDNLRHPDYLTLGLDLTEDDYESDPVGDHRPDWQISEHIATTVIGSPGSLWERLSPELAPLALELRVRVVEQLARYLTYKQVPFLIDLLTEAKARDLDIDSIDSQVFSGLTDDFWTAGAGAAWLGKLREFLRYFVSRNELQQLDILDGPIKTGEFARHTKQGESRERLREAFNTPLFPMVLIANEVMQEGLDLHKSCRRIVHHDLVWNPAQLEQRIGRIDRLGSRTLRLRSDGHDATLDVLYPVVTGTIDERLYRVVKSREKWLEFLLGAQPNFDEYRLADEDPPPLPPGLAESLAIDLRPGHSS